MFCPGKTREIGKGSGGFGDGGLYVFRGDDTCVGECGGGECVVREEVDLSREAIGGLENGFQGGGLEERDIDASEVEEVGEVGREFLASEAADVVTDDDTLG